VIKVNQSMVQTKINGLLSVNINSLTNSSLDNILGTISTIKANLSLEFNQAMALKDVQNALDSLAVPKNSTNLKVVKRKFCNKIFF